MLFAPGYSLAKLTIDNKFGYQIMALSFGLIGCATSSFYFTNLMTCAKIYPKNKGLTISAPVASYGLSSLIGAQLLKLKLLNNGDGLDLSKAFRLFSILYFVLGVFNWISSSVVTIEKNILLKQHTDEESPLLSSEDIDDDLVTDHKTKFMDFLKDISAYILLVCFFFTIGPSEMYITNMGSLIDTISPGSSISNQVSIHAIFSTLARLSLGALSDFVSSKYGMSRIWLLLAVLILGLLTQVFIALETFSGQQYFITSLLSGFVYGGLFTLFPTIVLSIWGSEIFGSVYGFYMLSPAIGSSLFGMLYGIVYDSRCWVDSLSGCVGPVFWITALSFGISAMLLILAWRCIWVRKAEAI
jgi:MFS family permease